jgi:hypothetical protein
MTGVPYTTGRVGKEGRHGGRFLLTRTSGGDDFSARAKGT